MAQFVNNPRPDVRYRRSMFRMSTHHKTTFDLGQLIPIYFNDIIPGDTFSIKTHALIRLSSPTIKNPMDNMIMSIHWFFVPMRLTWDKTAEFFGENKTSKWDDDQVDLIIPTLTFGSAGRENRSGSLADYFGIPVGYGTNLTGNNGSISILPFNGLGIIYSEWYRDENLQDPILVDTNLASGNVSVYPAVDSDDFSSNMWFGKPPIVNKFRDYFTSALPGPQKGEDVKISLTGKAPILAGDEEYTQLVQDNNGRAWKMLSADGQSTPQGELIGTDNGEVVESEVPVGTIRSRIVPSNLYASLDEVSAVTVNDLRFAIQLQRLLERAARHGTRYTEILQSQFGVYSPDSRLQRPEFMGGQTIPIDLQQVVQTSIAVDASGNQQGNIAGFSMSSGNSGFSRAFTEHGFIYGLACVRQKQTYQNGIPKHFIKKRAIEYFNPVFNHIGEQPIKLLEIAADTLLEENLDHNFGVREAWDEYRWMPDKVTGQFRSGLSNSLDVWHMANNFANPPVISEEFIQSNKSLLDRVISIQSSVQNQFIADFHFDVRATRLMATHSVPGYIDQN